MRFGSVLDYLKKKYNKATDFRCAWLCSDKILAPSAIRLLSSGNPWIGLILKCVVRTTYGAACRTGMKILFLPHPHVRLPHGARSFGPNSAHLQNHTSW